MVVTVNGRQVVRVVPIQARRRRWIARAELLRRRAGRSIDAEAAVMWGRVLLAESGRRANVNDLWIAATAASRGLPVVTQDDDFAAVEGLAGLVVVRV
ncbi:MAG: PIN domain-containing protein [Kineosporiaceae bacterium]|nr:PIN domain-containing protein [Kineosporiaceae bacterium]